MPDDFVLVASPPAGPAEDEGSFQLKAPEQMAWDMFFAAVASIQYHPANAARNRMTLVELARVADDMVLMRRSRTWR